MTFNQKLIKFIIVVVYEAMGYISLVRLSPFVKSLCTDVCGSMCHCACLWGQCATVHVCG